MCDNPFWKCNIRSFKPVVFISYGAKRFAICSSCWEKIAESNIEWNLNNDISEAKIKILQEIGDGAISYPEFHKICRKYGVKPSELKSGKGALFRHLLPSQTGLKIGIIKLSRKGMKILEGLKDGGEGNLAKEDY